MTDVANAINAIVANQHEMDQEHNLWPQSDPNLIPFAHQSFCPTLTS